MLVRREAQQECIPIFSMTLRNLSFSFVNLFFFFLLFLYTVFRFLIVALFILIHFFPLSDRTQWINEYFSAVWSYWILWNNWVSKWNHQLLFVMTPLLCRIIDWIFTLICCCLYILLLGSHHESARAKQTRSNFFNQRIANF